MQYKLVRFDNEENYINDFLRIPKDLYSKREIVQNEKEERSLLLGEHILSGYFQITKLLVYNGDMPCARCAVTIYQGDDTAYVGFFESINDVECAKLLFEEARKISIENKCNKIKGPVDASFWIKYRLKTNNFSKRVFVGEPNNKDYYLNLFLACGYRVSETYVSNYYKRLPFWGFSDKKCKDRYDKFLSKGYKIISPGRKDFDTVIKEIYKLLMELYADFPVFKGLSEEDFLKLFSYYRYILDFSFVKIAYYKDEAVGFMIGTPDYGNMLYGKLSIPTYFRLFLKRIRSSRYVILYMGVKREHRGLGNAMIQTIMDNVRKKRANTIGALIKEGKVTEGYVADEIISKNTYALLECDVFANPMEV
ncbi:MAG: hypothetical protein N3B21_08660 [Clostridia bacterium]|nr:hypothetical protein [Clostridia bacterium]